METFWKTNEQRNKIKNLQRLEAAQMKFLRHLLGITKLEKEKDQCIMGKKQEHRTV
jgi:hypothetical protein